MTGDAHDILRWKARRSVECGMRRRDIEWAAARAWHYDGVELSHATGGFFSVVGRRVRSNVPGLDGHELPLIDQPEVGILGFVVRSGSPGPEVLVQAKAEPGNVDLVQLAPTVQATVSNYSRVHGGGSTPYLDLFLPRCGVGTVADTEQSEHGTRFLGKYNRNSTIFADGDGPEPVSGVWRWIAVRDLLAALHEPYAVNTDARSTLVASDWEVLAGGEPFARHAGAGFGGALHRSYLAVGDADLPAELARMRSSVELELEHVRLDRLAGWRHDGRTLHPENGGPFSIPMLRVEGPDREVACWDQPLVRGSAATRTDLLCQEQDGVLRFQLRGSVEPGLVEKVQFGPSATDREVAGEVVARCRQSEEGGRFDRTLVDYRIVRAAGEPMPEDDFTTWATLGDIAALTRIRGGCTNELRSALSLLLAWL